ncbi:MAG: type II secretion system F family protein [Proteobacteria bacterium]|nr:type II secretion system F family protein [Pseudomonadota bacterium]
MGKFTYRARDDRGSLVQGIMEAENRSIVYMQLDGMGLLPVSVVEEKKGSLDLQGFFMRYQKVKYDDLIFFTRQLQTIVKAGIPIISGLKALEEQTTSPKLKQIIGNIHQDIDKGTGFSDAIERHKGVFPEMYISMVRAGEMGGLLEDVLEKLSGILEFQMKTKEMLKSAMRYPIMVISGIVVAFFVIVTFVIPRFAVLFKSSKVELPLPTKIMLSINTLVQSYGVYTFSAIAAIIAALIFYIQTKKGKLVFDKYKLKVPIIGQIILKICMSRFAYMFENMVRAGVPVIRTLEIVARTVGNEYIAQKIIEIQGKIEKGKGISKPLKESKIFPSLVIHLVSTGEETGSLEEMLREVSIHYDREVTYSIGRLSAWIEPIMTVVLSVMILFLALAVMMPWWNMMSALKGG